MAMNGKITIVRNIIGNCRNVFSNRCVVASHQQNAGVKTSIEEKLGLPIKPKRPLTPYFRFMAQIRPSLTQNNPDAKVTDIVKLIAQQWVKVDPAVRQKLENEYKSEMNAYSSHRLKYEQTLTNDQREEIQRAKQENEEMKEKRIIKKKKKELGRPRKPATGFIAFMQSQQSKRGDASFKDWQQRVVKLWEKLSDTEKAKYLAGSKQAMDAYKRDLQEWEEKMIRLGHIDMVRNEALIQPKSRSRTGSQE